MATPDAHPAHLARHGETEWSRSGRHTGRTDLPLTPAGEDAARRLGERLRGRAFALVLSSPLIRAWNTCELAGFGGAAERDADLMEWDYGTYDGRTTADIKAENPAWDLFRDGCPEGESAASVASRADRVIARLRSAGGPTLVFSSAHLLRVLAARWCGQEPSFSRFLLLDTGSLSVLGYAHNSRREPAIQVWNGVS